jgi:hypothetical protein
MDSLILGKYKCGDDAPISGGEAFEAEQKNEELWKILDEIDSVRLDSTLIVVPPYICYVIYRKWMRTYVRNTAIKSLPIMTRLTVWLIQIA